MDNRPAIIGVTVGAAGLAADLFGRALPTVADVRAQPPGPAQVGAVREQCARTAGVVLTLGLGASILVRSPWPAVGVAAVVCWLWWTYDAAARTDAMGSPVSPARPAARRYT